MGQFRTTSYVVNLKPGGDQLRGFVGSAISTQHYEHRCRLTWVWSASPALRAASLSVHTFVQHHPKLSYRCSNSIFTTAGPSTYDMWMFRTG